MVTPTGKLKRLLKLNKENHWTQEELSVLASQGIIYKEEEENPDEVHVSVNANKDPDSAGLEVYINKKIGVTGSPGYTVTIRRADGNRNEFMNSSDLIQVLFHVRRLFKID